MHDIAGLVALAVIGLWIAYLVPHRLRYRQQLLESRTEDRFSDALRVLAVTDARRRSVRTVEARAECGPDSAKRSGLLSPARGVPVGGRTAVTGTAVHGTAVTEGKGRGVERPYGTQDRLTADDARRAAQERARRAASLARRAAAARRRAVLTAVLLAASVAAWAVVGLTSVAVVAAVVPTVLLVGVLGLGRRAVVSGRAADAAWERRLEQRAVRPAGPRPRVTGRAQHPSDSHTEAISQVGGQVGGQAGRAAAGGATAIATSGDAGVERAEGAPTAPGTVVESPADESTSASGAAEDADADAPAPAGSGREPAEVASEGWSPVPVPRPTYTTKATAPRREPLPLVVDDVPAAAAADDVAVDVSEHSEAAAPSLDLDAILARRRAAGE